MDSMIELVSFAVCLILSACFSGVETALFSLNKIQLGRIRRNKTRANEKILKLLTSPQKLLATILLGNTIVNIAAASLFTIFLVFLMGPRWGGAVSIVIMPLILLVFGEITPKMFSMRHSMLVAEKIAPGVEYFVRLTGPLRGFLDMITEFVLKIFGVKRVSQDMIMTEGEFLSLIDISEKKGIVEKNEKEMIINWIDCADIGVKEIMTPRVEMVAIDILASREDVMEIIRMERYKYYPVYRGRLDKLVGVVTAKDIYFYPDRPVKELVRAPFVVPETKRIVELFREMQKNKEHVAIVVDEHGGIDGLVSIIDIVEEVTGSIPDEYDMPDELVKKIHENRFLLKGNLRVADANELLGLGLPDDSEDYDTVAGFLLKHMGKVPKKGEKYKYLTYQFTVRRSTRLKVVAVLLEKLT